MSRDRWNDARRLRLKGTRKDCAVCREPLVYHGSDGQPHPNHIAGKRHQKALQRAVSDYKGHWP